MKEKVSQLLTLFSGFVMAGCCLGPLILIPLGLTGFAGGLAIYSTNCGNENKVETTANGNNTKNVTFTITEMDCSSYPFVVKSSLERVKGVKTVEVTITEGVQGTAKVVFDASKTDVKT